MTKRFLIFLGIIGMILGVSALLSGLFYLIFCEIKTEAIFLIITAVTIFWYTYETYNMRKQSAKNQNLMFMSELIKAYDSIREANGLKDIYLGDPRKFMDKDIFPNCTKVSNFLDGIGQIVYHLSDEERVIALERWAEVYIRLWIRLKDFVIEKRKLSIKRDYPYFEWLASKSLEFHDERFPDLDINFYNHDGTKYYVSEPELIKNNRSKFRNSTAVEAEFIKPK